MTGHCYDRIWIKIFFGGGGQIIMALERYCNKTGKSCNNNQKVIVMTQEWHRCGPEWSLL